ncbi:RNA polymerase sigma factor [Grimontia celer]|uniref:RNA polymerase sigma factor n=1 Tax=Grimontia celer TaxID=1796497 RepID=A0A128F8P6_9GAMM|nr:sigma-70 family RNA polymerase sigma factor [Grimontia celer]CZF83118.1 RNA polymerase sigma factor [Grimontia celer]
MKKSQRLEDIYHAESAKILAALVRLFGKDNIELAEDTLQEAFKRAIEVWDEKGEPENPSAWLMLTAKNQAIDVIRRNKHQVSYSSELADFLDSEWTLATAVDRAFKNNAIQDETLSMIFWCCQSNLKPENLIPLILKVLCGFSLNTISKSLFLPEETLKKRLQRTKSQLKKSPYSANVTPDLESMETVHLALYLLFNEGVYSSEERKIINIDFCHEAMHLLEQLVVSPDIANRETLALYALMHFHMARLESRIDDNREPVPLDLQNRTKWDQSCISKGSHFLELAGANKEAFGNTGRFFEEASIAHEHCKAESFEQTNWQQIEQHYNNLVESSQSPLAKLNQAIAIAYQGEKDRALVVVSEAQNTDMLAESYLPFATLAHIYALNGMKEVAYFNAEQARMKGGSKKEHTQLLAQLARLLAR